LDLVDNFVSLEDFAKNDVSSVEPARGGGADEELGSVGIWTSVGHAEKALLGVLQLEVLIWEFFTIDGLATGAVVLGEVTALDHEVLDDTVEDRALISKALLASSQSSEVLGRLGDSLAIETDHDATHRLVAMVDIEVDLVGDLGAFLGLNGLGEEDEGKGDDE